MTTLPNTSKRRGRAPLTVGGFWDGPLGYPQAALVVATGLLLGFVFHCVLGYRVTRLDVSLAWPLAAAFSLAVAVPCRRWRERPFVRWLTGVPFALCSLAGVAVISLVGASVSSRTIHAWLGIESIFASWPFRMALLLMLVNLVGVTARRCWPLTYTNFVFTVSHLGLTLAVLGGLVGAADMRRGNLTARYDVSTNVVQAAAGSGGGEFALPFRVTLRDFTLRHFPPTLALARPDKKAQGGFAVTPGPAFVRAGMRERIGDYELAVTRFLPRAALVGEHWQPAPPRMGAPAAHVVARDRDGKQVAAGWVSCGNADTTGAYLPLNKDLAVYMPNPRAREYRSLVEIRHADGRSETRDIRVNQPATVEGYRLYQLSYDEERGAASDYSVFDVVSDRGLPVVYVGMGLLVIGALLGLGGGVKGDGAPR